MKRALVLGHALALAATLCCGAVEAQTYDPVADWLELPAGRETLGPMHGDIAVSRAGDVYVSVETAGMGVQVFSPDGRYLRSLANAPADLHGFVIRDAGDGEHIYGVSLRGQKFVKLTLAGDVVLDIARDAIPREYWTPNRFSTELGVLLSGMDVAPNGELYVTDGYSSDYVHRFDARGRYLGTFGGKAAPYGFNILHKIAMDTRFDPVRIVATDRLNNRVVHLSLDGEFLGVVNDGARRHEHRRRHRHESRAARAVALGSRHRGARRGHERRRRSVRRGVQHLRPRAQVRAALTAHDPALAAEAARSAGAAAASLRGSERIEADPRVAAQIAMYTIPATTITSV
jgi:hypothetical protein